MVNNISDISYLISYFNSSKGIPLVVTTTSQTSWSQFSISLIVGLIGFVFVFMYLWEGFLKPHISTILIKNKLRHIRRESKKPIIIIKHAMDNLFSPAMIDSKTLKSFMLKLNKLNGKSFDLVLYTPGGEVFYSQYIARIIKNYPGKVRAIIPIYAMSGGTLLTLACDEIMMSNNACLGPIDPQLGNLFKYGSSKSWNKIVKFKGKKAEDSSISFAMTGSQYTKTIRENIFDLVSDKMPSTQANKFADYMTSGDIEHAYNLTPLKLQQLGLPVKIMGNRLTNYFIKILSSSLFEGVYLID